MKNIYSLVLGVFVISLIFSAEGLARNKRCGLGSKLWGKNNGALSQVSEIGTNNIASGGQSVAMGTSGCKHDGHYIMKGFGMVTEDQYMYVAANREELIVDIATGTGEILSGFAEVMGCSLSTHRDFAATAQQNLIELSDTDSDEPVELILVMKNKILGSPRLSAECGLSVASN